MNPEFYEEIKIAFPLNQSEKLHLLFTFAHISCKRDCAQTPIGYAWLPLAKVIHSSEPIALSVFASLPAGYLSCQALGLGRGLSMPELRQVGKDLFRVRLILVSSVVSRDQTLHSTMSSVTRITQSARDDSREISKLISVERTVGKGLRALSLCARAELIRFSAVILQQLLRLMVFSINNDLICETLATVLSLLERMDCESAVRAFVDQRFVGCRLGDALFHEVFVKALNHVILEREEEFSKLVLKHSAFLLQIHVKSMVQYLEENRALESEARESRFSSQFQLQVDALVAHLSRLIVAHSRLPEAATANAALAHYLTRLSSFADRAFVFRAFHAHVSACSSRDVLLIEMRLHAIAILCAHEHHVLLNNALQNDSFALSEDFCARHVSVALLLHEFHHSLASQTVRHVRAISLTVLRNLLAKHAADDRLEDVRRRVVSLYLPAAEIILDNIARVFDSSLFARDSFANDFDQKTPGTHARHNSLPVRFDKFNSQEISDIVIVFLFIANHFTEKQMNALSLKRQKQLFLCLELALHTFEYKPRECAESRSKTLPTNENEALRGAFTRALFQQNLSVQMSLVALQTVRLYLGGGAHHDLVLHQVLSLFLALLSLPQSQPVLTHVFAHVRLFLGAHSDALFSCDAFLPQIIAKVILFCNSSVVSTRNSATDLLYCLFRANFKRTRFETIVCVSRLASMSDSHLNAFQTSLKRLESVARVDPQMTQMETTVQRIRDILRATQQIRAEADNYYENCELRLHLADSYVASSHSLRRTWIENLSEVHARNNDWTECAFSLAHVIAIQVQQLVQKGVAVDVTHIRRFSDNIETRDTEESDWLAESHVTVDALEKTINACVSALERAELYELAPNVLKVLMGYYEERHEHSKLVPLFTQMARAHAKALEANNSRKRIFASYFLVAFLGAHSAQYVYKESRAFSLAEMTAKMAKLHPRAHILNESAEVQRIDGKHVSILITHVQTHVERAQNEFERNVNVRQFVFEQRMSESANQSVAQICKKRVIVTTAHSFPFCLKRIPVVKRAETVLSPIEVAVDEMATRVTQLARVLEQRDAKHLQLVLQGSVCATVNCGPLAYAHAFLSKESGDEKAEELRQLFHRFLDLCENALKVNEKLIKSDQIEYQLSLRANFEQLKDGLALTVERDKRTSVQIFDVISGSSVA